MSIYFVVDVDEVCDEEGYAQLLSQVRPLIKRYGGRYLCKGGLTKDRTGEWTPSNLAIIEFPCREAMDLCFGCEEFRTLIPLRDRTSKTRILVSEGTDTAEDSREGLPEWMWNERLQVGTDYTNIKEIEKYDSRMGEFRDIDGENIRILDLLGLTQGQRLLEIGCGTGRLSLMAASRGLDVVVADISSMMLEYVAQKASENSLQIKCVNKGFLELKENAQSMDAVVSVAALHHLPDVWKTVAAENVCRMLRSGGQFVLRDVVFDWSAGVHAQYFRDFVGAFPIETSKPAARHAAKEFSTHDWIMQGILERAGFEILSNEAEPYSMRQYHCRKK